MVKVTIFYLIALFTVHFLALSNVMVAALSCTVSEPEHITLTRAVSTVCIRNNKYMYWNNAFWQYCIVSNSQVAAIAGCGGNSTITNHKSLQ